QRTVWRATQRIPRGQTRSYGQVAQAIGRPQSGRAVGQALASNPLPILIPCHRVVATDGSLRGFACGQEMKRRLLTLEGAAVSQCQERARV
ncbi:MAG: MGMT family protein, partial [Dehalococcoidia bacterium]|nr:MGMT family protein [Dehalococcoidia bacterium]